jgi:hypothetical protein
MNFNPIKLAIKAKFIIAPDVHKIKDALKNDKQENAIFKKKFKTVKKSIV